MLSALYFPYQLYLSFLSCSLIAIPKSKFTLGNGQRIAKNEALRPPHFLSIFDYWGVHSDIKLFDGMPGLILSLKI